MIDYRGYQMNDKIPLSENVRQAIDNYTKRYGKPPKILLETSLKSLQTPEGVIVRYVNIPKNVLLIGKLEEND